MNDTQRLLPFLWLRGEDDETLIKGIHDVYDSGCGSVCLESRIHPDFLGESWWHELDVVAAECKKLGMTFWVLDDTQFPSGYANGCAKGTPFCRMMLTERHMDVKGPRKGGYLVARSDEESGMTVAVIAARKLETGNLRREYTDIGGFAVDNLIDLTDKISDGLIKWDVPEGTWRVFELTARYVSERKPARFFANPLMEEGGRAMIDTVYEAHYRHLGAEFGKTFAGFFSDEPALRAGSGSHAVLGEFPQLPVAWRLDMPAILSNELGRDARRLLPGLWYDIGEDTHAIRYAYMNCASRLYGENYSMQIGAWCEKHGVDYIGHVIEQGDAHSRLGQGAGHFFRAVSGQHMSGMDYVLHEMKPAFRDGFHAWHTQSFEAEDDFFRYMLPQMTVSAAQLDPKKRGRALCELFGAYGWQEDAGEMRYIANLLLSRGINYYVPHAFSMEPFPDPDSPPHFGSFNPLMPAAAKVFGAVSRTARHIDGGRHFANVGVLYYAEAEWACGSGVMKTQAVISRLEKKHISCEIIPCEMLKKALDERLYQALIIPAADRWPLYMLMLIPELIKAGCKVAFTDKLPSGACDSEERITGFTEDAGCVKLEDMAEWASEAARQPVRPVGDASGVHSYVYDMNGERTVLLFNELSSDTAQITAEFDGIHAPVLYDPEENKCYALESCETGSGCRCSVSLNPGQLLVLGGYRKEWPEPQTAKTLKEIAEVSPLWHVSFPGTDKPAFDTDAPGNISDMYPRFSGTVRYECGMELHENCAGVLLKDVSGAVRVNINGKDAGLRVCAPYEFELCETGLCKLTVEVTNTLVFAHRDPLSFFDYINPTGLCGPVTLLGNAN